MTLEKSPDRLNIVPDDCECVYFGQLPPELQASNRVFRQAALQGEGPNGLPNSMCGSCIQNHQIQLSIGAKIERNYLAPPVNKLTLFIPKVQ